MSKPKKSDYQASETDKASAAVGLAQKNFFDKAIKPRIVEGTANAFRDEDSLIAMGEGRADADTKQALTMNPNRQAVQSINNQANLVMAGSDQLLQGATQGYTGALSDQVSGVKAGAGIANQTVSGLAQASKISTTDTLNLAKADYTRSAGMIKGLQKVGTGLGSAYQTMQGYNKGVVNDDDKVSIFG